MSFYPKISRLNPKSNQSLFPCLKNSEDKLGDYDYNENWIDTALFRPILNGPNKGMIRRAVRKSAKTLFFQLEASLDLYGWDDENETIVLRDGWSGSELESLIDERLSFANSPPLGSRAIMAGDFDLGGDIIQPAVMANTGSNEGDYVSIGFMCRNGKTGARANYPILKTIATIKTFRGNEYAWQLAALIGRLLGA